MNLTEERSLWGQQKLYKGQNICRFSANRKSWQSNKNETLLVVILKCNDRSSVMEERFNQVHGTQPMYLLAILLSCCAYIFRPIKGKHCPRPRVTTDIHVHTYSEYWNGKINCSRPFIVINYIIWILYINYM